MSDTPELMTDSEHIAVSQLADAYRTIVESVIGRGPTREHDIREVTMHIHALQHFVMAQAAARAYPGRYRRAGELVSVYSGVRDD